MKKILEAFSYQAGGLLVIVVIILGTIFGPDLLINSCWYSNIDLAKGSGLGSTLGGLVAPFIGFGTACLMFLALMANYSANKKQAKVWEDSKNESILNQKLDVIWRSFESIEKKISIIIPNKEVIISDKNYTGDTILFYGRRMTDFELVLIELEMIVLIMSGTNNIGNDYISIFCTKLKLLKAQISIEFASKSAEYEIYVSKIQNEELSDTKDTIDGKVENVQFLINKIDVLLSKYNF